MRSPFRLRTAVHSWVVDGMVSRPAWWCRVRIAATAAESASIEMHVRVHRRQQPEGGLLPATPISWSSRTSDKHTRVQHTYTADDEPVIPAEDRRDCFCLPSVWASKREPLTPPPIFWLISTDTSCVYPGKAGTSTASICKPRQPRPLHFMPNAG
jgi:hypothetical protein